MFAFILTLVLTVISFSITMKLDDYETVVGTRTAHTDRDGAKE